MANTISKKLKEELVEKAVKLINQADEYIKPRFEEIAKNEKLANNQKLEDVDAYRYNISLPIMSGFIDTLVSRISGKLNISFEPQDDADILKARKISAA